MVKYKNGTVGILNADGDVHVQNTNLFVYGKKVVHAEKCAPPGGRSSITTEQSGYVYVKMVGQV